MSNRILMMAAGLFLLAAGFAADSQAAETKKGLQFGGSIRGRYEHMSFSANSDGSKKDARGRLRYRLRLDAKANINSHSKFYFRLVSGTDSRSGNVTLGDPQDFSPNALTIRHAALVYSPWEGGQFNNGKGHWSFDMGRVKNPYMWKGHGKDMMLWDGDISLAGIGTQFDHRLGDAVGVFANTGYYAIDENSSGDHDPFMTPLQLGFIFGEDHAVAGIRGSYYYMDELDDNFISRGAIGENTDGSDGATSSGGNVPDGLTGNVDGGKLTVVSTQAFVSLAVGSVPLTVSGGYSDNTTAQASVMYPGVDKNSVAYNFGIEGGSKKKILQLGVGWYHIEANAFPSQFIDSDLLDGYTNRKGLLVFLKRAIMKNAEAGLQFFSSDAIANKPGLEESADNAKRDRLQIDLIYSF